MNESDEVVLLRAELAKLKGQLSGLLDTWDYHLEIGISAYHLDRPEVLFERAAAVARAIQKFKEAKA